MTLNTFFSAILNMSLTGSLVILAVMAMRLLLKKAPKIFSYVLWLVYCFGFYARYPSYQSFP